MPINVYTGLMRSGKSYEVVSQVILAAVLDGRDVVTNVDGISQDRIHDYLAEKHPDKDREKFGKIRHVANEDVFKPDFLPYYDDHRGEHIDTTVQPGDLVCIDEAWRFWGSDCKLQKNHKSFFLEHGHFTHPVTGVACDLVLMIQDMGTLHRFVKNVVAFSFRTHKKVSLGLGNTYSVQMWEGYKMNRSTEAGSWVRRYDKEIFPLYSSFKGGVEGKLVNVDKRQNLLANKRLWIIAALCMVGGGFAFRNIWNFFHPDAGKAASAAAAVASGGGSMPPGSPASTPRSPFGSGSRASQYSGDWRYVGELRVGFEGYAVVADKSGRVRLESPSAFSGRGLVAVGMVDGQRVTAFSGPSRESGGFFGVGVSPRPSPVPSGASGSSGDVSQAGERK